MDLTIIAALSENNVIGIDNKIPWRIKEDMARFKELTINHPVIMGRKTYESIPEKYRPLPDRKNIVLSKRIDSENGIYLANNLREAIQFINREPSYVMGGREIYDLFLPLVDKMKLTRIHKDFKGDTFFPKINWENWELINKEEKFDKEIPFSFLTYQRKK